MLRKLVGGRTDSPTIEARFCPGCGKEFGRFERFTVGESRRCKDCERDVRSKLQQWRASFVAACSDGLLSPHEWQELQHRLRLDGIAVDEATQFVRKDALNFVERSFAFAKADGELEATEEQHIRWLLRELDLASAAPYMLDELNYLTKLRNIREGRLPTINPTVILPADEICYYEGPTEYQKVNRSSVELLPGRLVVTNRRVVFIARTGGGEIPLAKVLNVATHAGGIYLELSRKANSGFYKVPEPRMLAEMILAAVRLATRQLIAPSERDTRRIPQHIKIAVWQRDQGQCVQCNATEYLEFDHVIPHSKGGATSENNLQLLCRRCNLQKGQSI